MKDKTLSWLIAVAAALLLGGIILFLHLWTVFNADGRGFGVGG